MDVANQEITSRYAIYEGDCIDVMADLPTGKIGATIHSPPFGGLFQYSSSDRDLSNCIDYNQFFKHYEFVVREIARITMPGRIAGVHCMDVPTGNTGTDAMIDFPGDIIRLFAKHGMRYMGRHSIWKEPLAVRLRTMQKNLAHQTIVEDSSKCSLAAADYLLLFRNKGENTVPIPHPTGLLEYAGSRKMPTDRLQFRGWEGDQKKNRYSHWIWRQYASSFWDDIRLNNVLPFQDAKDENDEKHVHPLQLDVIERFVVLRSNPGEIVLTPFMGVASEVFVPVRLGRKGIGIELKPSYYQQAVRNMRQVDVLKPDQASLEFGEEADMDAAE